MKLRFLVFALIFLSLSAYGQGDEFSPEEIKISRWIDQGRDYMALGRPDLAEVEFRKAVDSATVSLGEFSKVRLRANANLGIALKYQGKGKEGLTYELRTLHLLKIKPEPEEYQIARLSGNIGNSYRNLGVFDSALHYYHLAIETFLKIHPEGDTQLVQSYMGIGQAYSAQGDFSSAISYYNQALAICKQFPKINLRKPIAVYLNIAHIHSGQMNFSRAREFYLNALALQQKIYSPEHPHIASNYFNIGVSYQLQNQPELARSYLEKSWEIHQKHNQNTIGAMETLVRLGEIHASLGQYDSAMSKIHIAIGRLRKSHGPLNLSLGDCYHSLSLLHYALSENEKADLYADSCLLIYQKNLGRHHPKIARAYGIYSNKFFSTQNFWKSAQFLQKGIQSIVPTFADTSVLSLPDFERDTFLPYYTELAVLVSAKISSFYNIFLQKGGIDFISSALRHATFMEKVLEKWEETTTRLEDKANISQYYSGLAERSLILVNVLYQLGDTTRRDSYLKQAFRYMDLAKSRAFYQTLQQVEVKDIYEIPKQDRVFGNQLENKLAQLEQQLALLKPGQEDVQSIQTREEFFRYRGLLDSLETKWKETYPKYAKAGSITEPTSVSLIQEKLRTLPKESALLSFQVGDSSTYVGIITSTNYGIREIGIDLELYNKVKGFRAAIQKKDEPLTQALSASLYKSIWQYLDTSLIKKADRSIEQLILVPDGILHYLPFEALRADESQPYLIEQYDISYALSASLFVYQKNLPAIQKPQKLLAMAPVFESDKETSDENRSTAIQHLASNMHEIDSLGTFRMMGKDTTFGYLPFSKKEVQNIYRTFQKNGLTADVYFHEQAQENLLKQPDISSYTHIHLATHGFSNDQKPQLSGLAFSYTKEKNTDGLLFSPEAYHLNLEAELVTLSACETGLGRLIRGEGVLGLSRAFLFAGARNVMMSLWAVEDNSTSQLMESFYKESLAGKSNAEALRIAKLGLLRNPKTSAPIYWAPFVLIGQ